MSNQLDIINEALLESGLDPVNSLGYANEDTNAITFYMNSELKSCLSEGFWFNNRISTLTSNGTNVNIPANVITADPVDINKKYAIINNRYYDTENETDVIPDDVESYVTYSYTIEEIPYKVFDYVKAKTIYKFYRSQGNSEMARLNELKIDVQNSRDRLLAENLRMLDYNVNDSRFMRSWLSGKTKLSTTRNQRG